MPVARTRPPKRKSRTPSVRKHVRSVKAKRRPTTRARTEKTKLWQWLVVVFVVAVGLWLIALQCLSFIAGLSSKLEEEQIVALVNQDSSEQKIVFVSLQSEGDENGIISVQLPVSSVALLDPWQVMLATKTMVNKVYSFSGVNLSDKSAISHSILTAMLTQLKAGDLKTAWSYLPIWKSVRQNDIVAIDNSQSAASKFALLTRISASCPIGVANTTEVPGVASMFAELVADQGGIVVRVTNQDEYADQPQILIDQELASKCGAAAELLQHALPGDAVVKTVENIYASNRVGLLVLIDETTAEQLKQFQLISNLE